MTDEKYLLLQDSREKKRIGKNAAYKRASNGHAGKVWFPSDYLSRKELAAMNGECKTYRMNSPMDWEEFKSIPDELKILYITSIREKYSVSDKMLFADLFGKSQSTAKKTVGALGIGVGRSSKRKNPDFAAWNKWLGRVNPQLEDSAQDALNEQNDYCDNIESVLVETIQEEPVMQQMKPKFAPCSGTLTFEGVTRDALPVIESLLRDCNVRLIVTWEQITDGTCQGRKCDSYE